ncbi:unnamed protein product [Lymnaea stagnalis]|uniref:Uncharacterized protein n=1 Tax=Lymnaea stagnalis TaxID=6523 RepID=A0AAV2IFF1_LYMST
MNQLSSLFALFAFLQRLLGIHGLEITLDGFENINCGKPGKVCRSALAAYNITGRIILGEGELMPPFIAYEYKCPATNHCLTFEGRGEVWDRVLITDAGKCNYETKTYGCKLIGGRAYRHFYESIMYYYYRLCTVRARMLDKIVSAKPIPINAPGIKHVSNELKMSDYKNDSRYSLDDNGVIEIAEGDDPCMHIDKSKNGVDKIYLPDALLIILGSITAIIKLVIY